MKNFALDVWGFGEIAVGRSLLGLGAMGLLFRFNDVKGATIGVYVELGEVSGLFCTECRIEGLVSLSVPCLLDSWV